MKMAIIGYGKMGRAVERLGLERGHSFPLIIDVENRNALYSDEFRSLDVAVEFTTPGSAVENITACLDQGVPVVSGTTGWNKSVPEMEAHCRKVNGGLFMASNFSIGVNILFALNRKLAQLMNNHSQYSVSVEETHHIHKLDAPSGTAITLAEQIIGEIDALKKWSLMEPDRDVPGQDDPQGDPSTLEIHSIREGEVTGRHAVQYESGLDSITLIHNAKSRDAFATGVLMAAEFMSGKHGVFGMNDLLKL